MKTIRILLIAIFASFVTNFAVASGGLQVDFTESENNVTVVEMSHVETSHFEIMLKDAYGNEVYSMETDQPSSMLKKKFDFSSVEDGTYWFSVDVNNEKTLKKLNIEKGKVNVEMVRKSIQPFFTKDGDLLKLSVLNPHQESVNLYVYNSSKGLLAQSSLGKDAAITKAVDLSELRYGDYHVVITNAMDIYEYDFSIR